MARRVLQPHIEKKRILVVDEFPMLRYGVITLLNAQPDIAVCGEADSIPSTLIKIAECKPHVLVIGLRLGAGDTVQFVRALKVQNPELLIVVYSAFEQSIFAERALRAGANAYVRKKGPKEELLAAIRDVLRGQVYVSRDLAMRASQESLAIPQRNHAPGNLPVINHLSDREMHVFQLIGSGLATKEVAHSLRLRKKTVETHRENIRRKLGLRRSGELAERATAWITTNFHPQQRSDISVGQKKRVVVPFRSA